jgi:hypothetical protein
MRHRLKTSNFGASSLSASPRWVLPDVGIVARVPIAVRERGFGKLGWSRRSSGKRSAEIADGPWASHKAILEARPQARRNCLWPGVRQFEKYLPSGAKALTHSVRHLARLKSCPFKAHSPFRGSLKLTHFHGRKNADKSKGRLESGLAGLAAL